MDAIIAFDMIDSSIERVHDYLKKHEWEIVEVDKYCKLRTCKLCGKMQMTDWPHPSEENWEDV
jgi:hypothetical protein